MSSSLVRRAAFAGTSLLSVTPLSLSPLSAQTVQQPSDAPAAAESATPASDIVVTGTRLTRPDFAAPNPITSLDASAIRQTGETNIVNVLQRVPALSASIGASQSAGYNALVRQPFGGAGLNELNLRGLGSNRTLVLVNGRRHVAGEYNTAAVDTNAIPTDLVERVDVLTGGTSAVYGADGVSGVVNFILKRNFEGIAARAQVGISRYGDGGNRFGAVTIGHNFGGGAGNITFAYEGSGEDPLANDDRDYLRQAQRQYIVQNPNPGPGQPTKVLVGDLRYQNETPNGLVGFTTDMFRPVIDGNGAPYDPGRSTDIYGIGGSNTPVAGYIGDILPRIRRHAFNVLAHYDFSEAFKLSLEGKFVTVSARTQDSYTGDYPSVVSVTNPFVPAAVRTAFLSAAAAGGYDPAQGIQIYRDNFDFPRHGEDDLRHTYRGVIDASGRLSDHLRYDAYVEYGQTGTRITKLNDRLADRYLAALDVSTDPRTGGPVCSSNLPGGTAVGAVTFTPGPNSGCAPLNLFGNGSPSAAARAFVLYNPVSRATVTQAVASASVSGDLGGLFRLPGGPIQFSFGGEYRRETSRFTPDPYLAQALFYQFDEPPVVQASYGAFDVKEAFGELNVPLLRDVPLAQTLSFGGAARYSRYSTTGGAFTWQVNGVYAPVRAITFRASYSKAVRAPNIGELFAPPSGQQNFFTDPCDPTQIGLGTANRPTNCAALLRGIGVNPATFSPSTNNQFPSAYGTQSGNGALAPETAKTLTAGVVLRPRVRGLTIAVDYYDIKLSNAISVASAQQLAELCVDQPTIANAFCQSIQRNAVTGYITGYTVRPQNVAAFRVAGADLDVAYRTSLGADSSLDVRLVGGYLRRADFVGTPGAPVEDDVNQTYSPFKLSRPRWQANFAPTLTLGSFGLTYNLRFQARTLRFAKAITQADPNYAPADLLRYRALWQHDVQAEYRVNPQFALYGGVNNLSDQRPDPDATNLPISPLGRFMYVGVRVSR